MIEVLFRSNIPHARFYRIAQLIVLNMRIIYAISVGIQMIRAVAGSYVDHTVGSMPFISGDGLFRNGDSLLIITVSYLVGSVRLTIPCTDNCRGNSQRKEATRSRHIDSQRSFHGAGSVIIEVVDVILHFNAGIVIDLFINSHIVQNVIVVRHEIHVCKNALNTFYDGLIGVCADAKLFQIRIIDTLQIGNLQRTEDFDKHVGDKICELIYRLFFAYGGSIVNSCNGRQGEHPVLFAAGEQPGGRFPCCFGCCHFFRPAVCQHVKKRANGRAAKAVTDKVDLVGGAPFEIRN